MISLLPMSPMGGVCYGAGASSAKRKRIRKMKRSGGAVTAVLFGSALRLGHSKRLAKASAPTMPARWSRAGVFR